MLRAGHTYTLKKFFPVKRQVGILLTFILSACANQVSPPIVSPTAGNNPTSAASQIPASPTSTVSPLTATLPPQATNALVPILTSISPTVETTQNNDTSLSIPVTAPTVPPGTNQNPNVAVPAPNPLSSAAHEESDKFQNFKIPEQGEGSGSVIPLTGFPPGMITREKLGTQVSNNSSDLLLVIPSLDLSTPIVGVDLLSGTWDVSWLWDQAGWLEGTAYPTRGGNSVITAHLVTADGKNGPFAHLKALGIDEYIFIHSSGYRYVYQVIAKETVKPDDQQVFSHEVDSILTLVTCDAYDEATKTYLLRTVIRAKLVDIRQ